MNMDKAVAATIVKYLKKHPEEKQPQAARNLGISLSSLQAAVKAVGYKTKRGRPSLKLKDLKDKS